MDFFIEFCRHVNHGERIKPIDFRGHGSKFKVTMNMYRNKLVNTIETKPFALCVSSLNLADILTMARG